MDENGGFERGVRRTLRAHATFTNRLIHRTPYTAPPTNTDAAAGI